MSADVATASASTAGNCPAANNAGCSSSGAPHVYLTGEFEVSDADVVELRGTWEYAPGTQLKCEQLKFCYSRTRAVEDSDGLQPVVEASNGRKKPRWAGFYEGWFALKLHGREQKVSESFALWREDRLNGHADDAIGVAGRGTNSYGKFSLRGALEDGDKRLVLERVYGARVSTKKSPRRRRNLPVEPSSVVHNLRRKTKPDEPSSPTARKRQRVVRWQVDDDDDDDDEARAPRPSSTRTLSGGHRSPRRHTAESSAQTASSLKAAAAGVHRSISPRHPNPRRQRDAADESSISATVPPPRVEQHQQPEKPSPPRTSSSSSHRGGSSTTSSAAASNPRWCAAVYDEEQNEIYEGEMCPKTGLRHGLGACVYVSRQHQIYEGEWKLGREHGRGVLLTRDRRVVYDGEFADGKLHGRGLYVFQNGDVYRGDWRENCRHGAGDYVLADGAGAYSGEWRDNVRHGRGKLLDADGSTYEGDWLNDKRHGRGSLRTSDGLAYDGLFADDSFEGRGVAVYADGQRYEGMWRHGRKDGRGSLVWPNGTSYEGRFKDDRIDGQGTLNISRPTTEGPHATTLLVPIDLKTDIAKIHLKAGFDEDGN